jgi:alcohol dehydrogenase class IV
MASSYDFIAPPKIAFGCGRRSEIGTLAHGLGRRAFVVSGSRRLMADGVIGELSAALKAAGVESVPLAEIHREPTIDDVDQVAGALRKERARDGDFVLTIGGGSAIDLGKAAAAMATNGDGASVRDYLEGVTQLIESYTSRRARPIPRALAVQGLQVALPAIVEAVENGSSRSAREAMSHAALLSGMALANAGLGMAHGVAAALGIVCDVPHGLACAVMLPATLRANREVSCSELAALERATASASHASESKSASDEAAADAFVARIDTICGTIGIPRRLSEIGVRSEQIPALVAQSRGNSMSGNPRDVSDGELTEILTKMM